MRLRSVATVLGASIALGGALVRCTLPDLPAPPNAFSTRVKSARGMVVSLPAETIDRPALIASLKEIGATTIILDSSADGTREVAADRVALAIELQREVGLSDAAILIGTYRARKYEGKPMDDLMKPDPGFAVCYPGGPALDAAMAIIDKLRLCSQAVSAKVAEALTAANASPRIGCYITHEPELTDTLSETGRAKLADLLRDSAGACTAAKRHVAYSTLVTPASGDPSVAARILRDLLPATGVNHVLVRDGVGTSAPTNPVRASVYYQSLRTALVDRPAVIDVWADVESFDCEAPDCARTHPTTADRFRKQLCGAQNRVEVMVTREYLHDFAGRPLVTTAGDASPDLQAILDDSDASAQLRSGYLAWADGGPPCP